MRTLESSMLAYLLNSAWQAPLIFAAAWVAARVLRRNGAAAEHRVWTIALVLEAVLPACTVRPSELLGLAARIFGAGARGGDVRVTVTQGAALAHPSLRPTAEILAVVAVAYGCVVVYFAGRLAVGLWKTTAIRRRAQRVFLTGAAGSTWQRCCRLFGVFDAVAAVSDAIDGPMTIGIRRKVLLLPAEWQTSLREEDLDAAIAHEFAHMRRGDFAKNLVYEVLSLPVGYHPLLWMTRTKLAESREMVCDAMAAKAVAGRDEYARSLLRLASILSERMPARTLQAIGIFDANIFERRIMSLTELHVEVGSMRRMATAVVCVLLGVGTCASALALRIKISAPVAQSEAQPAQHSGGVRVSAAVMAGNVLTRVNPVYPPDAKAAGVSGTVVLHAIIGKSGEIESLVVVSGPAELQTSALDAVRQWRYMPYLLNGEPTEVDTTITVNYNLNR
ncbi:MAG TPA: M56 family metallopeptidase [Acidobacteriaceae bacterium]|nr:M56 family metallopeptidase [Acidobacteriaceae bacterium]